MDIVYAPAGSPVPGPRSTGFGLAAFLSEGSCLGGGQLTFLHAKSARGRVVKVGILGWNRNVPEYIGILGWNRNFPRAHGALCVQGPYGESFSLTKTSSVQPTAGPHVIFCRPELSYISSSFRTRWGGVGGR